MGTCELKNKKELQKSVQVNEVIKVRKLKTQPMYRSLNNGYKVVPKLLICGNWLQRAGFFPNQYVSITILGDALIIRKVENTDDLKPCGVHPIHNLNSNPDE